MIRDIIIPATGILIELTVATGLVWWSWVGHRDQ